MHRCYEPRFIHSSLTCADDWHALHVLEQLRDRGVITGVQSIAAYSQVELQPAGVRVKGHFMFSHSEVGDSCCFAVQLHMPEERGDIEQRGALITK